MKPKIPEPMRKRAEDAAFAVVVKEVTGMDADELGPVAAAFHRRALAKIVGAALEAALTPQSIDGAPRDGTPVLAVCRRPPQTGMREDSSIARPGWNVVHYDKASHSLCTNWWVKSALEVEAHPVLFMELLDLEVSDADFNNVS